MKARPTEQQISTALGQLARAANSVREYEIRHDRASKALDDVVEQLQAAKESFNERREQVFELFPEMRDGFSTHGETVKVVDGQIKVVEEDD